MDTLYRYKLVKNLKLLLKIFVSEEFIDNRNYFIGIKFWIL